MSFEFCKYCGGRGCLMCYSEKQRVERQAAALVKISSAGEEYQVVLGDSDEIMTVTAAAKDAVLSPARLGRYFGMWTNTALRHIAADLTTFQNVTRGRRVATIAELRGAEAGDEFLVLVIGLFDYTEQVQHYEARVFVAYREADTLEIGDHLLTLAGYADAHPARFARGTELQYVEVWRAVEAPCPS